MGAVPWMFANPHDRENGSGHGGSSAGKAVQDWNTGHMNPDTPLFPDEPAGHDPGGKVYLPLPPGMTGSAVFGGDHRQFRYSLRRDWDSTKPTVAFVMMNPSTADMDGNDPTVAKCIRYAKAWGYGSLLVGNVFALRATMPSTLVNCVDPIGPENDGWLAFIAQNSEKIILAYGKPPSVKLQARGPIVSRLLSKAGHWNRLYVLKLNKDGSPGHPLYLPERLTPTLYDHAQQRHAEDAYLRGEATL